MPPSKQRRVSPGSPPPAGEHGMPLAGGKLIALVYALCFLSGVAALIYEIAWAKMLALTFGSTTLAAAAVVAAFMGGMGLGARCYGLLQRRLRPLVAYGALEIGIAVTTALLTRSFYGLPRLFADFAGPVSSGLWLGVMRVAMVFTLLCIPAALMGATFPALCSVIIRTAKGVDRHLGVIYGVNTVGGAAGVLLGGLILIEAIGLTATVSVANAINILVGCTALLLVGTPLGCAEAGDPDRKQTAIPTRLPRWQTGAVLFISGFATLSYEIVWFRALRYLVGNSVHALSMVLLIFLVGLGVGSLLLQRVTRRRSPERDLALCQCLIAVLAVSAMACEWLVLSVPALRDSVSIHSVAVRFLPWWWRLLMDAGLAAAVMLPGTLAMGLSFPLATRLYLGDVTKLGTRVGGAYLLANLGSILGAVVGAVCLLPVFGTIGGTRVVAFLNLSVGIALWLSGGRRVTRGVVALSVGVVAVSALAIGLPSAPSFEGESLSNMKKEQVFIEEGDLGTVQVFVNADAPHQKVLSIDGYTIGWGAGYEGHSFYRKQVLLAHLPMVLDTRIRRTLNIGLGSAATLRTLASYAEVESLDCVEINGAVVRAAQLFDASAVLEDPRVNLLVDDAVHYLLRSHERYDLIISDGKQNPFYSGNASLLCREFYVLALEDLAEDGLFVQWIPLGTLPSDFRIILRTFCEVFSNVEVFFYPKDSAVMVGSPKPLAGRPGMSRERFMESQAGYDLAPYFIEHPESLLSRWVASKKQLMGVLEDVPVSTWDHLILDFSVFRASREEWFGASSADLQLLLAAESVPRSPGDPTLQPAASPYVQSSRYLRQAWAEYFARRITAARVLAEQAVQANPADGAARGVVNVMRRHEDRPRDPFVPQG